MATMSRSIMRVSLDGQGGAVEEERMLGELQQRFRDVAVSPEGDIFLITDEALGALLRVEPAD